MSMHALIVDDDEVCLEILDSVLTQMGYQVERAGNGQEALAKLRRDHLRIVVTDWEMPQMNGLELCRAIRQEDFDGYVYIIMLTCRDNGQQRIEGLHAGADAFLCKPLNPEELLVSLKTAERILGLETRDLAMFALAKLSESRDPETGAHIERVQSYARLVAQYLSTMEKYHDVIDGEFVRLVFQTSPLHDIGKVGIPDNVLLKPGKLTEQEFTIMKTHASLGAQTLEASLQRFPNARFLQMARDIAAAHHERWDGTGYPAGLKAAAIPLSARIVALADVYDALTSRRIYRDAMSHAQAKLLITRERGAQFDPDVVDAFLQTEKQFIAIKEHFKDADEPSWITNKDRMPLALHQPSPRMEPPVLIVDDDPVARDVLANALFAQGFNCILCENGQEALRMLDEHQPRIIISDWQMPGIDGLELCRRIRACSVTSHIHFIMLTVRTSKEDLATAFDVGVDDFLAKPFSEAELIARLRAAVRVIALYDELARQNQGSSRLNEQLTNLNQRLEKLAITDDLTGVYNRRQGMHRLEEHWSLWERYKRPLAVATIDIDHFKAVNDAYGHSTGDSILRNVADILRQCVRTTDTLCRIGGEEFLIVLPCQTIQEAEICAQRCRQAIASHEFDCNGTPIKLTISVGLAGRRSDMKQYVDLLREADAALYAAKRAGRNRVVCSRMEPGAATSEKSAA